MEAQIIQAVFPSPLIVMQTFLQRVFAQSVQGYVEVLMEKAAEVGSQAQTQLQNQIQSISGPGNQPITSITIDGHHSLAFLRALRMARSSALSLVNDLKLYDYRGMLGSSTSTTPGGSLVTECHTVLLGNGLSVPSSGASGNDSLTVPGSNSNSNTSNGIGNSHVGGGTSLSVMLDQAVDELFVPYMEGTRYLEKESKSLKELYSGCLARFTSWHKSSHQKAKTTTLFDRIRTQVSSSSTSAGVVASGASTASNSTSQDSNNGLTPATSSIPSTKSTFMKLSGLVDRARGAATTTASAIPAAIDSNDTEVRKSLDTGNESQPSDEIEGDLSLELAEKMLRWHAEAIGRCVDLSPASDV